MSASREKPTITCHVDDQEKDLDNLRFSISNHVYTVNIIHNDRMESEFLVLMDNKGNKLDKKKFSNCNVARAKHMFPWVYKYCNYKPLSSYYAYEKNNIKCVIYNGIFRIKSAILSPENFILLVDGRGWHVWQIDGRKLKKIKKIYLPRTMDEMDWIYGLRTYRTLALTPDGNTLITSIETPQGARLQYWPLTPDINKVEFNLMTHLPAGIYPRVMSVDPTGNFLVIIEGNYELNNIMLFEITDPRRIRLLNSAKLEIAMFNNMRISFKENLEVNVSYRYLHRTTYSTEKATYQEILAEISFPELVAHYEKYIKHVESIVDATCGPLLFERGLLPLVKDYLFFPPSPSHPRMDDAREIHQIFNKTMI